VKPYSAIGYTLLQTSAITAIVSTRVNHGLRPVGTTVPCINYYEVGPVIRSNGMESVTYSINCRDDSAGGARDLARLVIDLFHGEYSTGTFGEENGFEISRATLQTDSGLIPEPEDNIFNAPVDITIIYPSKTVS
jgi:hypothetical protein